MQSIVLGPDDPVKLTSTDDRDLFLEYDHVLFKIAAGATVFWPWKAACHLLGDPTLRDTPTLAHATEENQRMRRQFGVPGSIDLKPEEWEQVSPKVSVETMEGVTIKMVAEGVDEQPDFSIGYTPDDMKMRIAALEAQIRTLTENLSEETSFVVTETAPGEEQVTDLNQLPEDAGTARSARKRV
jgi:hypothetical protein